MATTPSFVGSPTKSQKGSFKKAGNFINNNYAKPKDFVSSQPQVFCRYFIPHEIFFEYGIEW